jgi:peptide/nickel transport system substrate-binding protein
MTRRSLRAVQGAALVAAGAMALSACGSSGGGKHVTAKVAANYAYGSIPAPSSNVKPGGVVRIAEDAGGGPNWIFPLTPAANSSVYDIDQFQYLSWRSLYWSPNGSAPDWDYSRSMTDTKPSVSADGKTFTIKLNGKYTWSDGSKVSAQDVLFWFDLYKAAVKENAANAGNYTPGQFPDNVTAATAVDDQTVTFTFDKAYNPDWVLGTEFAQIIPMPAKAWAKSSANGPTLDYSKPANAKAIYDYLASQSKSLSTYGTNPLWQTVDGPYKIKTFNASTSAATFVANSAYTGEGKPNIAEVDLQAYTTPTAEFNDLLAGNLDFGYVKSDNWPQLPKLKAAGLNVYGLPSFGFNYMYFNFKNTTDNWDKAIGQLYVRQAFAHLQDEPAEIKGIYQGLAAPAYGPLGAAPKSPYTPASALTNPFPYSVSAASKLLSSHGWTVKPGGTTTCTSPGTAANQCGAGITQGQNLNFTFYYTSTPASEGQSVTAFAANLKKVGINVTLKTDTFNNIIQNQSIPSSPKLANTWGMAAFGGFTENIYPSTINLFNTGGSYNQGGFSDPKLDALIQGSQNSLSSDALKQEITAVDNDLPGIFQPNEDRVYAWSPKLSGSVDSFAATTQFMLNPEDWYFTK